MFTEHLVANHSLPTNKGAPFPMHTYKPSDHSPNIAHTDPAASEPAVVPNNTALKSGHCHTKNKEASISWSRPFALPRNLKQRVHKLAQLLNKPSSIPYFAGTTGMLGEKSPPSRAL